MPYNDELNRQYTKEEAKFWREVKFAAEAGASGTIRIIPIAEGMGISEQQAAQYVRTWANDDLVRSISQNGRVVTMTPFGRTFTFEERYGDIENGR